MRPLTLGSLEADLAREADRLCSLRADYDDAIRAQHQCVSLVNIQEAKVRAIQVQVTQAKALQCGARFTAKHAPNTKGVLLVGSLQETYVRTYGFLSDRPYTVVNCTTGAGSSYLNAEDLLRNWTPVS